MVGISINPIRIITRVWSMGMLGRTLIVALLAMIGIAVFVVISSEPKLLTECPYYGVIAGIWILGIIGLYLGSGILSESPRLKVTWRGGGSRLGRKDVGDLPLHVGGMFFGVVITATNIGGKNLSLEPKMILHEAKTGKKLYEMSLMEVCPRPAIRADDKDRVWHQYYGERPPHCPSPLELKPDDTVKFHLEFLVEKDWVDRIGFTKVAQAHYSLKFVDTMHGIFEFEDKGRGIFKYRHLRSH